METSVEALVIRGEDHNINYDHFLEFGTKLLSGDMTVTHPTFLLNRPIGKETSGTIAIGINSIGIHNQPGLSYKIEGTALFIYDSVNVESQLFTGFISFDSKKWILAIIEKPHKDWQIKKIQAEFPLYRRRFSTANHFSLE